MSYLIFDLETTTKKYNKRTASPFCNENWVVAAGYKEQDGEITSDYFIREDYPYANGITPNGNADDYRIHIPVDVSLLVGFNIKFDLLWSWKHPDLVAFFKRGGVVWDCQYAEYLLNGAVPTAHMVSMDDIILKYGGALKIDEVKAMWKMGINTPDINKDLLLKYLAGEDGDIANTERIFLGQVKACREKGILRGVMSRMDGLCATTECEYNGIHVDVQQAMKDKRMIEHDLAVLQDVLADALPTLPPELTFNWGSPVHKSCLLYGGAVKYKKWTPYLDEDGNQLYSQQSVESIVLNDGRCIPMKVYLEGTSSIREAVEASCVRYKGGKRAGEFKTKLVKVDDCTKPKGALKDYVVNFPGLVKPKPEWLGALKDGQGGKVYSTSGEIIQLLAANHPDMRCLNAIALRDMLQKDLGTYYMTGEDDAAKGMLTLLDGDIIHHSLNHVQTVTTRLSSNNPNAQNIPRADYDKRLGRAKSVVKRMFTSRFDGGKMIESDYSQLEVVVQGLLTKDEQLIQDINDGVDFHCKRLAAKLDEDYADVYEKCHDENHPMHAAYRMQRTAAKGFTFARAFGAGKASIAADTGMSEDEVQSLIDAEEIMYPGVSKYFDEIEKVLASSRIPTTRHEPLPDIPGRSVQCGIGYYHGCTETIFGFYEVPLQKFMRKKLGRDAGFYRPSIQNYPIQGTAGHIVQMALGRVWRHLVDNDSYGGKVLLVNTVHDCVILDCQGDIAEEAGRTVTEILESVPSILKGIFNLDCPVPFPCECEIGDDLLTMKGL